MEAKRICPYCMGELESRVSVCPHCGGVLAGRNPAGSLPVGTLLAGRYTVGEMQSIDGEGILYRGVENVGRFRVTIKEYMPLTLSAERGTDALLRPKLGSEVLFKTTRMDFADLYRSIQRITPANGLEAVLDVVEANNSVYAILENLGVELSAVRKQVEEQIGRGTEPQAEGNIPYTPRVRKVLAMANREAQELNHTYVGTEHLLLGLIRDGDGVAGQILRHFGVDLEQARRELLDVLTPKYQMDADEDNIIPDDDDDEEDEEEGTITIYGDPKSYAAIQKHLEEGGFEDVGGEFTYIANDLKDVEPAHRETIDKMVERLEEFDDVQTVYTNMKPEESEE